MFISIITSKRSNEALSRSRFNAALSRTVSLILDCVKCMCVCVIRFIGDREKSG